LCSQLFSITGRKLRWCHTNCEQKQVILSPVNLVPSRAYNTIQWFINHPPFLCASQVRQWGFHIYHIWCLCKKIPIGHWSWPGRSLCSRYKLKLE
jgi:hypothetical protein